MALNPVQVAFVREVVRPLVERIILHCNQLDAFIADYDNQQTPIPNSGSTPLDDNNDGTAPRIDAPQLTGDQIGALRTFVGNMRAAVSAGSYNALVSVSVRSVEAILRGGV